MTIFLGSLLSFTRMQLGPIQKKQVEIDTKKKILGAVMDISTLTSDEVLNLYNEKMKSIVIDLDGEEIIQADGSKLVAEEINIQKNYKIDPKERKYPVFMFSSNGESVDYYIFPMFGNGLWDWISGFIALDEKLNTVIGVAFDHKSETPGLGARISSEEIQDRYKGKMIYNQINELVSVKMLKSENNKGLGSHEVDGMSGATITAYGLNDMISHYFECYDLYISKIKTSPRSLTFNK